MAAVTTDAVDGTEDAELDARVLTEYMTVLEDGTERAARAEGLYTVTTESGSTYLVDPALPACECRDFEYRGRRCKHIRRVRFALGWRPVPHYVNEDNVDSQLGIHVSSGEGEEDGDESDEEADDAVDRGDGVATDGRRAHGRTLEPEPDGLTPRRHCVTLQSPRAWR